MVGYFKMYYATEHKRVVVHIISIKTMLEIDSLILVYPPKHPSKFFFSFFLV
ncbi:hypothetical protein LguiA_033293 [Lonicera macranthoides]